MMLSTRCVYTYHNARSLIVSILRALFLLQQSQMVEQYSKCASMKLYVGDREFVFSIFYSSTFKSCLWGIFMVRTALMRVRSGDYRAAPYLAASSS